MGEGSETAEPALIRIGQIVGAFGLKGFLKVTPSSDFPARFSSGTRIRVGGEWTTILECRWQKGRPMLLLEGIKSVDAAMALQWSMLEVLDSEPDLEEGEYRTRDLIGLAVVTQEGEVLGTLDDVERYPAQDVFLVGEIRIPAVKEFVHSIDLEKAVVIVQLLPGMRPGEDE